MRSLEDEFFTALARMHQHDHEPWPNVGLARIEVAGRLYRLGGAINAFIIPEIDGDQIVDLIAWKPDCPQRWYQRRGAASVLGLDNLRAARFLGEPLEVYANPERWLLSGKRGAVMLDGDYMRLIDLSHILVKDPELGERIYEAHRAPPPYLPQISVMP
jgi:hypothetical protein